MRQQCLRTGAEEGGPASKNALFYRTINGAHVGHLFMSLIHTAELCGANPFDYLTELLRHPRELAQTPSHWGALELPGEPCSGDRYCRLSYGFLWLRRLAESSRNASFCGRSSVAR